MFRTAVLAAALLGLAACSGGVGSESRAGGEIAEVSDQLQAAFNRGDPQAMAAFYSEEAIIMAPGAPWLQGRSSVAEVWRKVLGQDVRNLRRETVEMDIHRNTATEVGRFTFAVPDGEGGRATVPGKYMVHWKRDPNGAWQLNWDIWNESPPEG